LRDLAQRLQGACLDAGLTVATAESCTGGLVASAITDVSGSSDYFRGGVVAYANEAKAVVLGVPTALLEAHGAVSAQVARAMAVGARQLFSSALAVSVTGIAGPLGGSSAKPVGLTYVGVADDAGVEVRRFVWPGDRLFNKEASARAALLLLLERVAILGSQGRGSGAAGARSGAGSSGRPAGGPDATGPAEATAARASDSAPRAGTPR
jgi:nicotinamide-nucleotide amidase